MFNFSRETMEFLTNNGAFLTAGNKPNVMTISWGAIGVLWGKKIMIVPVRESRYTKEFIDNTGCFSVSVPYDKMFKELNYCGSKSGRDCDKIKDMGLNMLACIKIPTFYVDGCDLVLECKVITKLPLTMDMLPDEYKKFYSTSDMHTLYIAEVV